MKGTIIINYRNLEDCPGLEQTMRQLSESIERDADNILFLSREGALMTMICELLDKDVKYTLKFDAGIRQPVAVKVRSAKN